MPQLRKEGKGMRIGQAGEGVPIDDLVHRPVEKGGPIIELDELRDVDAALWEKYEEASLWAKYKEVCETSAMLRADMAAARERHAKLKDENAELRELVRFMWFADYAGHFSTLPEHQEHQAAVWQRMCELGIEVDG